MRDPVGRRPRLTRRRALEMGAALVLVGGATGAAVVRRSGYVLPPGTRLIAFRAWEFVVVRHAARRVVAPDAADVPSSDDLDVAGFVDRWASGMIPEVRRDLGRFLAYLEHVAPLGVGFASRFTRLDARDQDAVLASVETSRIGLLRAGFDGLKALVVMGYYRDSRTWKIVGYDGPLLGRPQGGWR